MSARVWFKVCRCHVTRDPHGNFHDSTKGRCPTPILSMESGTLALRGIAEMRGLSAKEVADIFTQLRDAGMPARCDTDERVAALFVREFFK